MAYSTTRTGSTSSRRYLSGVATSSDRKEPSGRGSNTGSAALFLARHNRAAPAPRRRVGRVGGGRAVRGGAGRGGRRDERVRGETTVGGGQHRSLQGRH